VDVTGFILSQTLFDILIIVLLLGALVIGFIQGAIRRVLGILAIVLSFLVAANLREPVGGYLAEHWRQYPAPFSVMLGFLMMFLIGWVALSVLIQGFYRRSLIHPSEQLDEILGALLGVVQGLLLLAVVGFILDSYYLTAAEGAVGIEGLHSLWSAWDPSQMARLMRDVVFPAGLGLLGWLIPAALTAPASR
jgi:uncharacterized membrane protein required for colicin V production